MLHAKLNGRVKNRNSPLLGAGGVKEEMRYLNGGGFTPAGSAQTGQISPFKGDFPLSFEGGGKNVVKAMLLNIRPNLGSINKWPVFLGSTLTM